jgi:hypothetical protein
MDPSTACAATNWKPFWPTLGTGTMPSFASSERAMPIHHIPLELNSDFYGLNMPATLELLTDERPVSADPEARYEEFVVSHRLLVNRTQVYLPIAQDKLDAVLREYLDSVNEVSV